MLSGDVSRFLADNALLEPQHTRSDVSSLLRNLSAVFTAAEHIDDIDRLRNLSQRMVAFLAQNIAVHCRINRNDPVTPALHGISDHVRGAVRFVGKTDNSNITGRGEDVAYLLSTRVLKTHSDLPPLQLSQLRPGFPVNITKHINIRLGCCSKQASHKGIEYVRSKRIFRFQPQRLLRLITLGA
ncbi:hypothetical protein D3C81_1720380 [compost metagenome]